MGMDTSGRIYPLADGERPKPGHFLISEEERLELLKHEAAARADVLRTMRQRPGNTNGAKRRARKAAAKSLRHHFTLGRPASGPVETGASGANGAAS